MDETVVDQIADRAAQAIANGVDVPPPALRLLLRRFAATGRDDWRDRLQVALTMAIENPVRVGAEPARWLVLAESLEVSTDQDLAGAVSTLTVQCRSQWPIRGAVAAAAGLVDFCLAAGAVLPQPALVAAAVDELERLVGIAYEPGDGVAQMLSTRSRTTGDMETHAAVSLALLRAYDVTGRLAYPMLSEELMLTAMKASGGDVSLDAVRVLVRLALLQRDEDYRQIAVTRDDGAYADAAERALRAFDDGTQAPLGLAASYGLAVDEWLRLT